MCSHFYIFLLHSSGDQTLFSKGQALSAQFDKLKEKLMNEPSKIIYLFG